MRGDREGQAPPHDLGEFVRYFQIEAQPPCEQPRGCRSEHIVQENRKAPDIQLAACPGPEWRAQRTSIHTAAATSSAPLPASTAAWTSSRSAPAYQPPPPQTRITRSAPT